MKTINAFLISSHCSDGMRSFLLTVCIMRITFYTISWHLFVWNRIMIRSSVDCGVDGDVLKLTKNIMWAFWKSIWMLVKRIRAFVWEKSHLDCEISKNVIKLWEKKKNENEMAIKSTEKERVKSKRIACER